MIQPEICLKSLATFTSLQIMQDASVIPVIVVEDLAHAVSLAQALVAGGIRMLEVTLRTPAALDAIKRIAQEVPDAIVGAGTVCHPRDAESAVQAGARFAVSPGYTQALGQYCRQSGLTLLPGVSTASEIMMAMQDGYTELKFFPAVQSGGVAMLKALGGPFGQIKFCPTGGITPQNAIEFLALKNVMCVGGSWLAPSALMEAGDFSRITELAAEAVALKRSVLL
jgi:2-dehydro-3-deoxyphosphogluconate aldolase/(4S)-4-hydroxy-2-oxoglutarate aldolase